MKKVDQGLRGGGGIIYPIPMALKQKKKSFAIVGFLYNNI